MDHSLSNRPAFIEISQFDMKHVMDGKTTLYHLDCVKVDYNTEPPYLEPSIGRARYVVDAYGALYFQKATYDTSD